MSDSQTDPRSPPEDKTGRDAAEGGDALVPRPAHDEATVELVRDAIGVARGELSDERFSEKYGTADEPPGACGGRPDDGGSDG
ncbi:hypothetical protein CK500_10065 [Halorubrum salipaludis]|uniref:4Fe-4S ferredoxin iron-sulfur binding domain-containing protein n=1 Tax=Halorubrum salipaludis TaxID=2032630 RepID=A0A2A2FF10_9EURY|nr:MULTISPECIES: hypothetical protein [Halorubrum]PAU83145.1 hypothetical protein CK500_10065 [Halorubrum salipaludis]